jgi:hypothetical protein
MALTPNNDMFKIADHVGEVFAVRKVKLGERATMHDKDGKATKVAEVGEMAIAGPPDADGNQALSIVLNVVVFGNAVINVLAQAAGDEWLIGRWGQGLKTPGKNAAWLVLEIPQAEMDEVEAALASFDKGF